MKSMLSCSDTIKLITASTQLKCSLTLEHTPSKCMTVLAMAKSTSSKDGTCANLDSRDKTDYGRSGSGKK